MSSRIAFSNSPQSGAPVKTQFFPLHLAEASKQVDTRDSFEHGRATIEEDFSESSPFPVMMLRRIDSSNCVGSLSCCCVISATAASCCCCCCCCSSVLTRKASANASSSSVYRSLDRSSLFSSVPRKKNLRYNDGLS